MLKRVLTAFIGLVVFFVLLLVNPMIFTASVCIFTLGMLYELYKATKTNVAVRVVGFVSGAGLICGMLFNNVLPFTVFSVMMYLILAVFIHGKVDYKDIASSAYMTWFITIFMMCVEKINSQYGFYMTIVIFVCAWFTDTFAFFAGSFLGKNKLIPHVSPKKTVEGAIGGVLGAILMCLVYVFIMSKLGAVGGNASDYVKFGVLGFVASILAQFGDLIASAIKRDCNIKDFGNLFPGHGGILDRFDSVVFIAPVVYFYLSYIVF